MSKPATSIVLFDNFFTIRTEPHQVASIRHDGSGPVSIAIAFNEGDPVMVSTELFLETLRALHDGSKPVVRAPSSKEEAYSLLGRIARKLGA